VPEGEDSPRPSPSAPDAGERPAGPWLARAVLDAARAQRARFAPQARTASGRTGGGRTDPGRGGDGHRRLSGYSGPGPDPRDPQPIGAVLQRLIKARGWQRPAAEATLFGAWDRVVGADLAARCRPVKLADSELTVEAESPTWAAQLRLLAPSIVRRIAAEVGHDVVRKLRVHGPAASSLPRGSWRVRTPRR